MKECIEAGGADGVQNLLEGLGAGPGLGQAIDYALEHTTTAMPDASYFEEELRSMRAELLKRCYSICFCDDPYNESLWLKYADAHRGFVQVYDFADPDIICCGRSERCRSCMFEKSWPSVYPIYYSDEKYDATLYVMVERVLKAIFGDVQFHAPGLTDMVSKMASWEIERISLIKKHCHEHDGERRMICPYRPQERPAIEMKPSYVILGLRMPEYERRLVVSAARVAGIQSIREMYIDDSDCLSMREIGDLDGHAGR